MKVLEYRRKVRRINRGQRLPDRGEKRLYVNLVHVWYYFRWRAHRGYILCAECDAEDRSHPTLTQWSFGDEKMPVRRRPTGEERPPLVTLSTETKILHKCPLLLEWITATVYEDGKPRKPGYFQVKNKVMEYECTVYDPDAGMRIAVRSRTIDNMFAGVEAILGATEAPWEVDNYLTGLLPKPKKKK